MYLRRLVAIAVIVLISACAKNTTVRSHSSYEQILKERHNIAFLPAAAEVYTVGVGNRTRMYDYESSVEGVVNRELPALIRAKGYEVTAYRKNDIYEKNLSRQLADFRNKYDAETKNLYASYLMKEENAHNIEKNLGPKATELGSALKSDLLVLVDYGASVQTNGARAMNLAVDVLLGTANSANVDSATIMLSIIDAKTGNFLWSNIRAHAKGIYGSAFDNLSSQEEIDIKRVNAIGRDLLARLPNKNELGMPKKK